MTTQQMCLIGIGLAVSAFSLLVALMAVRRVSAVEKKLKADYWTKNVIAKTINAKVGVDQMLNEREQRMILNDYVENVCCKSVGAFCEELRKSIDDDPFPCSDLEARQLGFSCVRGGRKFYFYIGLEAFVAGENELPVKRDEKMGASEVVEKLIDYYEEKR